MTTPEEFFEQNHDTVQEMIEEAEGRGCTCPMAIIFWARCEEHDDDYHAQLIHGPSCPLFFDQLPEDIKRRLKAWERLN
jgi:hypothetical protein